MKASIAAAVAAALMMASCSTFRDVAACENAAVQQALAERAYGSAVDAHEAAHKSGEEHSDSEIFDARVTMILTEAETRQQCG